MTTANVADVKAGVTIDFFGLADGIVALDSPDNANTIKVGVRRERASGPTGRRRASSGSHGSASYETHIFSDRAGDRVDHDR